MEADHQKEAGLSPLRGEKSSLEARLWDFFLACPLCAAVFLSGGRPLCWTPGGRGQETVGRMVSTTGYTYTQCPFGLPLLVEAASREDDFLTDLPLQLDANVLLDFKAWSTLGRAIGQLALFWTALFEDCLSLQKYDNSPRTFFSGFELDTCSFGLLLVNNNPASLWFSVLTVFNSFGKLWISVDLENCILFLFFFFLLWKSLCYKQNKSMFRYHLYVLKQYIKLHTIFKEVLKLFWPKSCAGLSALWNLMIIQV